MADNKEGSLASSLYKYQWMYATKWRDEIKLPQNSQSYFNASKTYSSSIFW